MYIRMYARTRMYLCTYKGSKRYKQQQQQQPTCAAVLSTWSTLPEPPTNRTGPRQPEQPSTLPPPRLFNPHPVLSFAFLFLSSSHSYIVMCMRKRCTSDAMRCAPAMRSFRPRAPHPARPCEATGTSLSLPRPLSRLSAEKKKSIIRFFTLFLFSLLFSPLSPLSRPRNIVCTCL